MSWVRWWVELVVYYLPDSELFILFAENREILLKISVIPILLTFMSLVAMNLLVNNQLNHHLTQLIIAAEIRHIWSPHDFTKKKQIPDVHEIFFV